MYLILLKKSKKWQYDTFYYIGKISYYTPRHLDKT